MNVACLHAMNADADSKNLDRRALAALLAWQVDMGADEAIVETPQTAELPQKDQRKAKSGASAFGKGAERGVSPASVAREDGTLHPSAPNGVSFGEARDGNISPQDCESLDEIFRTLDSLQDFPLRKTATNTVYVDGHPQAPVLLIGEAPGRDEDLQGRPFVGRSGRLLDLMLEAIGLSRTAKDPERAVLITNVVFWRPPGNRKPEETEVAFCMPWLIRTVEIVRPRIIVCLGATPTQRLTGRTQGILRLRGTWLQSEVGTVRAPLLPMLHPAYLLRQPLQKRLAWRDMLTLKLKLIELGLLPEDAGW